MKKKEKVNTMSETYLDLPSRLEDAFPEIDNDIVLELQNENEEYAKLQKRISDLKRQEPFLMNLLDGSDEISLTAEEHAAFVQYLHLVRERDDMERQQIYFRGHTDAVAYLRKIKAIWMCIELEILVILYIRNIFAAVKQDYCRKNIDKSVWHEYTVIVAAANSVYCRKNNQMEV